MLVLSTSIPSTTCVGCIILQLATGTQVLAAGTSLRMFQALKPSRLVVYSISDRSDSTCNTQYAQRNPQITHAVAKIIQHPAPPRGAHLQTNPRFAQHKKVWPRQHTTCFQNEVMSNSLKILFSPTAELTSNDSHTDTHTYAQSSSLCVCDTNTTAAAPY